MRRWRGVCVALRAKEKGAKRQMRPGKCVDGGVFVLSSGREKEVSFGYCYSGVSNVFGLDS